MSHSKPVVAAIPNFNMGEQLAQLLPRLVEQGYDDILVLDDASTDGSREITAAINSSIKFVAGEQNLGAGGNRNRAIGALGGRDVLIHFLDADVDFITDRAPEVVNEIMPAHPTGFVGGLVANISGMQSVWNFGPRPSLNASAGSWIQMLIEKHLDADPDKANQLRARFDTFLSDWPNPLVPPSRRQVFWTLESNQVIDSKVFEEIGGFDETLREHDALELAIRMSKAGLPRFFDPALAVVHKDAGVHEGNRNLEKAKAEFAIVRKHGFLNWLMPDGKFKPEL